MRPLAAVLALLLSTPATATVIQTAAERRAVAYFEGVPAADLGFPIGIVPIERRSDALGALDLGVFQPHPTSSLGQLVRAGQQSYHLADPGIELWYETLLGGASDPQRAHALLEARITFTVVEPVLASVYGQASVHAVDPGIGTAIALALLGAGGPVIEWGATDEELYLRDKDLPVQPPWHEKFLNVSVVLAPGEYTLAFTMETDSRGTAGLSSRSFASASIAFAPIPEPGTLALVGMGLAWLARSRR